MSQKLSKHTPYFELVDAQAQAGCPICRLVYKATDRYLDGLLYEAVLDPAVRAKLKHARGFCAPHVEMLTNRPGRSLGVALIYRDIIRTVTEAAEQTRLGRRAPLWRRLWQRVMRRRALARGALDSALAADQQCPACTIGQQAEANYVELLLAHLQDDKLFQAYASGEGLCLPHLLRVLGVAEDEATLQRVVQPQLERYRFMLRDLDEFIRKRDHRFRTEPAGEEGDVWLRAMNAVVGGAGMGLSARWGGRRDLETLLKRK